MIRNYRFTDSVSFIVVLVVIGSGMMWYANNQEYPSAVDELGDGGPVVVIYTASAPFADIITTVGGSRVAVRVATSAEEYDRMEENDPAQRGMWFVLGAGVDKWVNDIARNNHPVVSFINDAEIVTEAYSIEIGKVDSNARRHYLLSMENGKRLALAVARELGAVDVVQKSNYISNAYQYSLSLSKYINTIETELGQLSAMSVIAQDHLFDDFLAFVGVDVVGVMNWEGDREEALEDLIYNVRYFGIDAVVVDDTYATQDLFDALQKTSANVVVIDGVGKGTNEYVSFVRSAISALLRGK